MWDKVLKNIVQLSIAKIWHEKPNPILIYVGDPFEQLLIRRESRFKSMVENLIYTTSQECAHISKIKGCVSSTGQHQHIK